LKPAAGKPLPAKPAATICPLLQSNPDLAAACPPLVSLCLDSKNGGGKLCTSVSNTNDKLCLDSKNGGGKLFPGFSNPHSPCGHNPASRA
jgi:hypothetical protein